jgi:hypothetical protein
MVSMMTGMGGSMTYTVLTQYNTMGSPKTTRVMERTVQVSLALLVTTVSAFLE